MSRLDKEKNEYYSITTFNKLCEYNVKYCKDEKKYHPAWRADMGRSNLYETGNDIKKHLINLNKNGFFTICSQPTVIKRNYGKVHEILSDAWCDPDLEVNKVQRAFVSGIMRAPAATKLFKYLHDKKCVLFHEKTIATLILPADYNPTFMGSSPYESIIRKVDNIFNDFASSYIDYPYTEFSYPFTYSSTKICALSETQKTTIVPQIKDAHDLVGVEILSKNFGDKTDFWDVLDGFFHA